MSCFDSGNVIIKQLHDFLGASDIRSCCEELEVDPETAKGISVGKVRQKVLDSL